MEEFPDKVEGDNLGAGHINSLNQVAREFRSMIPEGLASPFKMRVMCITGVFHESDVEDVDADTESSFSSSSSYSNSSSSLISSSSYSSSSGVRNDRVIERWYEAFPMYYDRDDRTWKIDLEDNGYDLDAGAFDGEFEVGDTCIAYWDSQRGMYVGQPVNMNGCESQNAIVDITILGIPTDGAFFIYWTINGTTATISFAYNDTAANFLTKLLAHSQVVTENNLRVTGGPFPVATMRVEFRGNLSNQNIPIPLSNWSSLTGGAGTAIICALAQRGHE